MKRLLSLLLLLILPVCALAETYEVSVQVKTDDEVFASYAKEFLQKIPGLSAEDEDRYVQVLRALLKDSGMTAVTQDDAVSMDITLAGESLIDLVVRETDTASYITSSLLPGYALVEEISGESSTAQSIEGLDDESTWQHAADSVETALSNWLADIEPTTTRGMFEGDAFAGGTQCTTWILTDMDVAACVSALATDEVRSLLTQMLTASELDAADLLAKFDEANDRVADENKYLYILRVVRDDAGQFVGLSFTVADDTSQLATISFGMTDKEARLVVGLGLKAQNYWWEYKVQTNTREHLTFLKGSSREWVADKVDSFGYVSETNAPVASYIWNCNLTKSGQRTLWDGTLYSGEVADASKAVCSYSGSVNSDSPAFEASIRMMKASRTPLKLDISGKLVDAIPAMDEALVQCSVTDPAQAQLYNELSMKISTELVSRLIKIVPLDVILSLDELMVDN